MESKLFRKAALERLSSPEQLDTLVSLTEPRRWLALAGLFLVLGAAVVWGFQGTVATKVSGSGIIVRGGTVLNLIAPEPGLIAAVHVRLEQRVKADQVLATITGPDATFGPEYALKNLNLMSPFDGRVIDIRSAAGSTVAANTPVLRIQPDPSTTEALVYLPSSDAKAVQPGIQAEISLATAKREEYGFIRGRVAYIGQFPADGASLMTSFGSESLVRSMLAGGMMTELRVILDRDPGAPSGYRWSSSRGPALAVSSGTLCTVQIVTRRQAPVTLILPALKRTLGLG